MPSSHPLPTTPLFPALASALDRRSAPRLAWLLVGAVLASGRRTVTSWIRAAGLSGEYRHCYAAVAAAGRKTDLAAAHLARGVVKPLVAGVARLTFAIDDTPTPRYGRHGQGAGVHHHPSPGPAGGPFVDGQVWVALGLLATHPARGASALPLLRGLYVRAKVLPGIPAKARPAFRTKLAMAVESVQWAVRWLGHLGKPVWVVADGAYAKAPFLKLMTRLGVTVVSRLRKDEALWSVSPARPGRRGRPRLYAEGRVDLAKRGGQRRGWATGTFALDGKPTAERYKAFVATWRPAGGAIRVALADEPKGWVAFFCTGTAATAAGVRESFAAGFSLGIAFGDCKETVGAGQQQVRRVRASVGAFHVCPGTFTLTEAWAWRRELLAGKIHVVRRSGLIEPEMPAAAERRLDHAAGV